MANPRKFSEKIALQKQKQAEGTAEFEKIMNEVKATRVVENTLISINDSNCSNAVQQNLNCGNGGSVYVGLGGSSGSNSGASGGGASPDANCRGGGPTNSGSSPTLVYRESRGRSVGVGPMRRPAERKQDRSPYGSGTASGGSLILGGASQTTHTTYLSPPIDSSWRRSNSDSALHQTLNMAEGNYGPSDVMVVGLMNDMNSLHANYAQAHNHQQRSHSPNIGRSFSPQAQKRKSQMMLQNHQQQQQAQQLQQHQLLQIQHQQQAQQQQMQHQLQQQQLVQQQLMSHQQSTSSHYNTKCTNAMGPANAIFKSLQDQQMNFGNNTGSLPDLTSVHFSSTSGGAGVNNNNQTLLTQQHNHHQQQSLTPMVSPHNNGCHPNNREQSSSPYSSSPNSSQQQQQNSTGPTSTANAQTSPHLTFTNLRVQCALNASCQVDVNVSGDSTSGYSILPTLGGTNTTSTSNMTNYRQPLNPPSPGSSPGLLTSTSVTGTELNVSAPPSPIRHLVQIQHTANNSLNGHHPLQKTFGGGAAENSGTYNSLNPAFHNHFEQFHLGDSNNQSPQTNYESLEFEDFVDATSQQHQQQSNITFTNKLLDFVGELTAATPPTTMSHNDLCSNSPATLENICHRINNNNNNTTSDNNKNKNNSNYNCRGSNNLPNHLNNNAVIIAGSNSAMITNLSSSSTPANNNETLTYTNPNLRQNALPPASSPISQCMPSASSPLPIPMSSGSTQPNHHQLSLSVQTSPHQSPLHSPHQTSSPLLVSSPRLTLGDNNDAGIGLSPIPSPAQNMISSSSFDQDNNQSQTSLQQHTHQKQPQQQQHQNTTNTNIPQIIFSDYSSSRDIFDHLDLDLGQIDEPGLQMLSDQGSIMIADPSIEDNFRRDLN